MPSTLRSGADLPRRLAALVPQILSVQVETVTDTTTQTLTAAVEHVADALLSWHDALIGGPVPTLHLEAGIPASGSFRPFHRSAPDTGALAAASLDLRRCRSQLQSIVDEVSDQTLRSTGQQLTDVVGALAALLQAHVEELRALRPGAGAPADTRSARVARAERALHRRVLDTLRA